MSKTVDADIEAETNAELEMMEAEMPHNQIISSVDELRVDMQEEISELKDGQQYLTDYVKSNMQGMAKFIIWGTFITILLLAYIAYKLHKLHA
jgi:hypothetical protein